MLQKFAIAIEALTYIALNSGDMPVSSKEICKEIGVSLRYTESIMQKLVKSGILRSVRGAGGGYFIAKERRNIDLAELYHITANLDKKAVKQNNTFSNISDEVMQYIDKNIKSVLSQITLEEIYNKAKKIPASSGKISKTDFVI